MKITKSKLKQIIREELSKTLKEAPVPVAQMDCGDLKAAINEMTAMMDDYGQMGSPDDYQAAMKAYKDKGCA